MKMLKTTVLATALLATSPLFANTEVGASASVDANANPGLLSQIGQDNNKNKEKVG